MGKIIDITGEKFSRWTVKSISHQIKSMIYWNCICECGTERTVFGGDLKRGGSKSCGCLTKEVSATRLRKHGMVGHPAYSSWQHMKTRCGNLNDEEYQNYGARGINVVIQWWTFDGFWADMGKSWRDGATIDRIDNEKGYGPGNCRWATPKQQARNRRTNVIINTPKGPMPVSQAAEVFGIKANTIFSRIRYGWHESRLLE